MQQLIDSVKRFLSTESERGHYWPNMDLAILAAEQEHARLTLIARAFLILPEPEQRFLLEAANTLPDYDDKS